MKCETSCPDKSCEYETACEFYCGGQFLSTVKTHACLSYIPALLRGCRLSFLFSAGSCGHPERHLEARPASSCAQRSGKSNAFMSVGDRTGGGIDGMLCEAFFFSRPRAIDMSNSKQQGVCDAPVPNPVGLGNV